MADKSTLRESLKRNRDERSGVMVRRMSEQVCKRALRQPLLDKCKTVALYNGVGGEVQTTALYEGLIEREITVVFPRCSLASKVLQFIAVDNLEDMRPGAFDIPEPRGSETPLHRIDLVMLPGVGFDERGSRLGRGAGYYDRTLEDYRGYLFGLAFEQQLIKEVPMDPHDLSMHAVVTESRVIHTEAFERRETGP